MKRFIAVSLLAICALTLSAQWKKDGVELVSGTPYTNEIDASGTLISSVGNVSGQEYSAFQFTADNTGTIESITLHAALVGAESGYTCRVWIYTDSSDDPGSAITNGESDSFAYSNLSANPTYSDETITWSEPYPEVTSGTVYHIVVQADQIDASNYMRIHYNGGVNEGDYNFGDNTPTWTLQDTSAALRTTISGTE